MWSPVYGTFCNVPFLRLEERAISYIQGVIPLSELSYAIE